MAKGYDRDLAMDREIARRDALGGVALIVGTAAAPRERREAPTAVG